MQLWWRRGPFGFAQGRLFDFAGTSLREVSAALRMTTGGCFCCVLDDVVSGGLRLSSFGIAGGYGGLLCYERGLREAYVLVDGPAEFLREASDFVFALRSERTPAQGADALA